MIDFKSLSDKGIEISGFPSHENVAFNMRKDSVYQKRKFIGIDQGPASMGEVVHLYNIILKTYEIGLKHHFLCKQF